jgi:photosystem II stability/assembly factor-like uncharacterized protein
MAANGCSGARAVSLVLLLGLLTGLTARASAQDGWAADSIEWSDPAPLAQHSLLLDAVAVGSKLVAVGERGHILLSEDSAESWVQVRAPTRRMLTTITAADDGRLWAAGHDAVILHSSDGGHTWSRQFQAPELEAPLFDIWVDDDGYALAVGAYGLCLESADGGEGDRGRTWESLPSPYDGSFFGILVLSDESLLAFGLRGHLYRSDDGGYSWKQIMTHTGVPLLGGFRRTDGALFIVGLGGTLLVSTDGGWSFTAIRTGSRGGIAAAAAGRDQVLLVGEGGVRFVDLVPSLPESRGAQGGDIR